MDLIYVEWNDACSYTGGWKSEDDAKEWAANTDWIVRQAGFLLYEDERQLTLVGMYEPGSENHERTVGLIQKIPKTWIRRRINLSGNIKDKEK